MKTLTCDLCQTRTDVATYTLNNEPINIQIENTYLPYLRTDSFLQKPPKTFELCIHCSDKIKSDYIEFLKNQYIEQFVK